MINTVFCGSSNNEFHFSLMEIQEIAFIHLILYHSQSLTRTCDMNKYIVTYILMEYKTEYHIPTYISEVNFSNMPIFLAHKM